jgi:hypothetical protein
VEANFRGGCLCCAVRYEAVGDSENASYCHCDNCKKNDSRLLLAGEIVR